MAHPTALLLLCTLAIAACGTEDSSADTDAQTPDASDDTSVDVDVVDDTRADIDSDAHVDAHLDVETDVETDATRSCDETPPMCTFGCGGDFFETPDCVDDIWVCPDGTTPMDECPPGSCFGLPMPGEVCDEGWQCRPWETGALPACDADSVQVCADCAGFEGTFSPEDGCDCTCSDGFVTCGPPSEFLCGVSSESTLAGVTIELPFPDDCVFTLAEAAAGLDFSYAIVVSEELTGVTGEALDAGNCDADDAGGFAPFERVAGGEQNWCICDEGLCDPTDDEPSTIAAGTIEVDFTWYGRNFDGPSDTGFVEGDPFVPGDYVFSVTMRGTVDRGGDALPEPYEVRAELPFRLVD